MQVALNENHQRIGEGHPQARYSNAEVALVFRLREQGLPYSQIGHRLDMPKSTVASILQGRRRCQTPAYFRTITPRSNPHDHQT